MAKATDIPYPPSPTEIPEGYTDFSDHYLSRQKRLMTWMSVVLLLYAGLVIGSGSLTLLFLVLGFSAGCFFFVLAIPTGLTCLYMLWLFFKRSHVEKEKLFVEVTAEEHPKLFGFIDQLCDEVGVDPPDKVFVFPEPTAAAIERYSLVNLFTKPERHLAIGIGLINALNLSEFKAVLAHEFGHFAQFGQANVYVNRAIRIIINLIDGQDAADRLAANWRSQGNALGFVLFAFLWLLKFPLILSIRLFSRWQFELDHEAEYHADRVAASLAGSNAIVHCLYRVRYAGETFGQALDDLRRAADHKLYTSDIYYHQHAVGDLLKKQKKDPKYGLPPQLADTKVGRLVQVFDPEKDDEVPEGDYHPSMYAREENVKKEFVDAEEDTRSAWILFSNPVELREEMSWKIYRQGLGISKNSELSDPKKVQKFIDDEHQETTYDDKYEGAYDDRLLNPGDLDELDELIRKEPWDDTRLATVHGKLYQGLKDRVEERRELQKELEKLQNESGGATNRRLKKIIKKTEQELEDASDWFRTLDRRVYLVYMQMSYRVNNDYYYDLANRYRFHMAIQGINKTAQHNFGMAIFFANAAFNSATDQGLPPDLFAEIMHELREARLALKRLLRDAKEINMPAMKNFEEGERLADFLLDQDLIREPREHTIEVKWISKLLNQLEQVREKARRLHFKSIGGILAIQEKVANEFLAKKGLTTTSAEAPLILDDDPAGS